MVKDLEFEVEGFRGLSDLVLRISLAQVIGWFSAGTSAARRKPFELDIKALGGSREGVGALEEAWQILAALANPRHHKPPSTFRSPKLTTIPARGRDPPRAEPLKPKLRNFRPRRVPGLSLCAARRIRAAVAQDLVSWARLPCGVRGLAPPAQLTKA